MDLINIFVISAFCKVREKPLSIARRLVGKVRIIFFPEVYSKR